MPILSPSLQNHLVNSFPIQESDRSINFILRYLRFASMNINKNYTTFKTSILFKNDLKKWIHSNVNNLPLISKPFIDIYREDIRDYYKYLYDKIDDPAKNYFSKKHDGNYFICDDGFQTKLFQPFSMNPVAYTWFLSDTPIAILCIDGNKLNYFNFYYWIKLEIDLMAAAGFTLVFCGIGISGSLDILLKDHQFAEIHLNNNNPNYFGHNNLDFDLIKSNNYFYFYTIIQNKESKEIIKNYKNDSHFHIFSFCKTPKESIKKIIIHQTREFYYCQTGFSLDFLCIRLSNIPIYDSKNDDIDFTPSESSGISIGYIKPNDFLRWSKNRKEILFDKECKHLSVKYINYDDIHLIKPELYVNDTLSLADISTAKYDKILKIKPEIIKELTKKDKFKKERFFNLCKKEKKIENLIKYASYAYSFIQSQNSTFFEIHEVQLLTALEACNQLILNKTESKGTIFQVETGEGKSCIINIIAAALVLMKKTVHIVSSNIILSNRDYNNSLDFFNLLGFSSAVLLHENELPYNDQSKKTDDITDCDEYLNKCFNYSNNPDIEKFSKEKYPEKFFGQELFENPLRMNLEICGVNIHNDDKKKCEKAQIVFSTFVNFECLYLKLVESSNDSINKYFSNCGLIIDEADSILIDEIENGTILSTSMNTNAIPIQKFVYDQHKKNASVQNTLNEILKIWPKTINLKERDIKQMYDEIDLINEDEFTNGKKYSIESFTVDENNEILVKKFYKKTLKSFEKRKDDDIQYPHSFKYIVPFDYNGKGILEPNKEFNGNIQQFIAIKESEKKENENLIIKNMSMNYLYVSHPIFTSLYSKICGVTGTIGNEDEESIYKEQYHLDTMKIPRNKPNLMVNFPMIICETFEERNQKIVSEVVSFHKKNFPVLVIFQDLKEIDEVVQMLFSKGIKYINIFNGKNESVQIEKIAGYNGAVSIGTNICGRGTDISVYEYPLHIIVAYYSSNSRVMMQAFGRTARHGKPGTTRIICHKNQFLLRTLINKKRIKKIIEYFDIKNKKQIEFIDYFKKKNPWIFNGEIPKQKIKDCHLEILRKSRLNVNRIVAYRFKFPLPMKYAEFIDFQAQRIFSFINCPNCIPTWKLFKNYIREMILESWSLMIKEHDQNYMGGNYIEDLNVEIEKLKKKLDEYVLKSSDSNIIDAFIEIHKIVTNKYEKKINQKFNTYFKRFNSLSSFFSCQIGFIPFSLLNKSGSRIDSGEIGELNYIIDPELIYERKNSENRKFILSITERIDEIFNSICQKINELINQKIGLKFFLRRGLAGCEFGLCLDLEMQNEELNNDDNYNLFDKDPLLLFSISVKSVIPIFAGILIIALVYIGSICAKIIMWITSLIPMATKELIGAFIKVIIKTGAGIIIDKAYDTINDFLFSILIKQINIIKEFDIEIGYILENIFDVFYSCEFDTLGEKISNLLDCKIKIKSKIGSKFYGAINYSKLIKTSVLLILCIGSFIFNFSNNKKRVKNKFQHEKEVSSEYETNFQNNFLKNKAVRYITNKEKVVELTEKNKDEVIITDELENKSPRNYFNNFIQNSNTFVLKMETCNIFNYIISPEYCIIGKMRRKIGSTIIHDCKCARNSYIRIQRQGYIENVHQEVVFYSVLKHLMIINFLGFYTEGKKSYVFISNQQNGFLDECIENKKLNYTQKLIIAYGIARIMRYLHRSKIIHGDLRASNILLNSNFYPKLYNFYKSRHIEKKSSEIKIDKKEMQYMPPEFILDSDNCCNSFKIDVYSYGLLLFSLITDSDPFANYKDKNKIYEDVINGIRPQFPPGIRSEWKDLINNCWDNNPNKRPNFEKIIAKLRYDVFQKDASEEFDNFIKYFDQIENKNIISPL